MSKESDLRAMREARYAARTAGAKPAAKLSMPSTKAEKADKADKAAAPAAATSDDGLCGHRSMNGRTCTREQGHSAKSHRYS